jgi:hypothetical protein
LPSVRLHQSGRPLCPKPMTASRSSGWICTGAAACWCG